jgi:hypothetical protein
MTAARRSYLLQATKVNLLVHARRFTLTAPIFRWSSESGNEVTTTILYREGAPTARKIHFEGSYTHGGSSAASATSCVRSKSSRRDSLNSLIFQSCGGFLLAITLGCHEWYNLASSNEVTIRRFEIAAGMLQYCYEANAKNI